MSSTTDQAISDRRWDRAWKTVPTDLDDVPDLRRARLLALQEGAEVEVYRDNGVIQRCIIRSVGKLPSGDHVAWVTDIAGCYALARLVPVVNGAPEWTYSPKTKARRGSR